MPDSLPRKFSSPDELVAAVGEHLGCSDWLSLDQSRIDAFAEATGDRQWIHVDLQRAARGPHGCTIAHGYLTLSLLPALVASIVSYAGWTTRLNYGSNKVRFPAAVRSGSRVRASAELVGVSPAATGLLVTTQVTLEHEYDGRLQPKPALVAEVLTLLLP
ncbi:MAG: MaoC family dehydratase [Nocardioidaceae bacterium]|nr:MaoC family dehydratase [Nocardioidaceae bacterium]